MKNFTITLDGTNRHFSIALNATTRRFTIRPGVGPQGPQGIQGATGATGPQGPAGPNSVTSATTSDGTADLSIDTLTLGEPTPGFRVNVVSDSSSGLNISATGTGNAGIVTFSEQNVGINAASNEYYAIVATSLGSTALQLQTQSGTYFAEFYDVGNLVISAAIERVRGWFVWFFNTFTGRLKTADITANRDWTLPDADGTIALTTSNVATATALQNSRNIFGIAFNGTANVSGDATNAGHFASIPTGGQAGHFITLNGTAPTVIAGRSAWWSDSSGNPSFRNGTGNAVTLVRSSDLGTGVATALAVNTGTAGAFVVNGGALGTPSSGTLTSCTGLPISTGVSGLAANVATFLATPTSANLRAALTDPTGTGANVHANSPTISNLTASTSATNTAALTASGPTSGVDTIRIQGTTATSYSSIGFIDSTGVQRGSFGIGNASAASFAGVTFINANLNPLTLGTSNTERLRILTTGEIGIGTSTPSTKAVLELSSTTRGFLPPRMTTTQRDAITSVPAGLMIYNTSTNKLNFYNGSAWEAVTSA